MKSVIANQPHQVIKAEAAASGRTPTLLKPQAHEFGNPETHPNFSLHPAKVLATPYPATNEPPATKSPAIHLPFTRTNTSLDPITPAVHATVNN